MSTKIPAGFYSRYSPELQVSVDAHRDHYDESIEYLDSELARFMQRLRKNAKASDPMLILTADHGESFERGFLNHGEDLYETSIRVPLIIQFPGQKSGYRWGMPAQSINIAPTILRAANIPIPSWADGIPLDGRDAGVERYHIVVNYKDPDQRGIYDLPTKLAIIHRQKKLIVSCGDGGMELYDLAHDPGELKNLAKEQVESVETLSAQLRRQLGAQRAGHKMTCDFNFEFESAKDREDKT